MSKEEAASIDVLVRAHQRWATMPPVPVKIPRIGLHALVQACQISVSHPALPTSLAQQIEHVGRQLMEVMCDDPELYTLFELGWHRECDVDPSNDDQDQDDDQDQEVKR